MLSFRDAKFELLHCFVTLFHLSVWITSNESIYLQVFWLNPSMTCRNIFHQPNLQLFVIFESEKKQSKQRLRVGWCQPHPTLLICPSFSKENMVIPGCSGLLVTIAPIIPQILLVHVFGSPWWNDVYIKTKHLRRLTADFFRWKSSKTSRRLSMKYCLVSVPLVMAS